jgi:hypothetical protein
MYVAYGSACDEPNSETPMTQARIDAQNRRVARVGSKFTDGNSVMAALVNALTPPAPVGTCDDLTTSDSMFAAQAMAAPLPAGVLPGGGVSPVAGTPAALAAAAAAAGSPVAPTLPGASYWFQPGGGSSYPYGPLQNRAGRLVPPWACQPSTMGDKLAEALSSPSVWVLGGLALLGVMFAGSGRKGNA